MQTLQWNATDYARHSTQQQVWARELIAKLGLRGDESVLDIGCGDGKVTAEIAALVAQGSVLGVDSSAQMVALAQQRFPPEEHPNLLFQQEDARDLPFCEQFSVVFSNATLHWVRDHRPVLLGIQRSLKNGGKALLQMGGAGNIVAVVAVMDKVVATARWASYLENLVLPFGYYGPDEYRGWLHEAGLTPQRIELFPKDAAHDGAAGFTGWLRTTQALPYLARLPEHERETFIAEIVEGYVARHPADAQGKVHVRMMRLEVEATK